MNSPKNNSGLPKVLVIAISMMGIGLLLIYGAAVLAVIGTLWITFIVLKKMFWG